MKRFSSPVPWMLLLALAACDGGSPSEPRPAQLQAVSGSGQTAPTESALPDELVARVTDSGGRGLPGVTVAWSVDAGGGALSATSTQTDAAGEARVRWTLGAAAGAFSARATVAGLPPAVFSATGVAAPQPPLRVTGLTIGPNPVNTSTAAADVEVRVAARADAGLRSLHITVQSTRLGAPQGQVHSCEAPAAPVSGTSRQGTWACTVRLPRGAASGTWSISMLGVADSAGVSAGYTGLDLMEEGLVPTFQVVSANEDVTGPTLTALAVSPAAVNVAGGGKAVEFTFSATDAGTGMGLGSAAVLPPEGTGVACSAAPHEGSGAQAATFRCSAIIPASAAAGAWRVEVHLRDAVGNERSYSAAQLQAEGFPHQVAVTR